MIINIGSFPGVVASWLLTYFGGRKIVLRPAECPSRRPREFGQRLSALLHDPLRFGMLWQMVYMTLS